MFSDITLMYCIYNIEKKYFSDIDFSFSNQEKHLYFAHSLALLDLLLETNIMQVSEHSGRSYRTGRKLSNPTFSSI